ncbi:MAG TPA: alkaline phosphatase D family protein [Pseudorhodoplanes sp.]|nr:alkaline phosphatase D family protein [Pseudorhodoplanes sp.]
MAGTIRAGARLTRRRLLTSAASSAALTMLGGIAKPYLSRAADRPRITHGIQSGDVSIDSGIVWARTDRPARMLVEVATSDRFTDIRGAVAINALPESDFTARALIEDLPAGQDIFYRIRFEDLAEPTIVGEAQVGRFRIAPDDRRPVSFVWSGDTAGQGWGIDAARGGMRTYATMLRNRPDFFIHSGDSIYADCPIPSELRLPNGETWRNVVTEEKSAAAQSLADYRGNYKYNLLDANMRQFNAEVPIFAQWDDHEVTNDWWPGETRSDYADTNASLLAARGRRAFCEYMPMRQTLAETGRIYRKVGYGPLLDIFLLDMRSYRGPNDNRRDAVFGPGSQILGAAQTAWLKRSLTQSNAIWKVIAADLPIGLISEDAIAQGDGAPLGREFEIAGILSFIKHAGISNTVWITADMHYAAAHYYDPNRAVFQDFDPFWEFVSGPIHAGTWAPADLDNTFGPKAVFAKGCTPEQGENLAPCFGLQFFGHVAIDDATEVMTVTLKDVEDRELWSTRIEPKRRREAHRRAALDAHRGIGDGNGGRAEIPGHRR